MDAPECLVFSHACNCRRPRDKLPVGHVLFDVAGVVFGPADDDDWINAVAGLVYAMRDQSEVTTFVEPIVFSAPRTCFGDDPNIGGGWVGGSGYAPHLDSLKRGWPEY